MAEYLLPQVEHRTLSHLLEHEHLEVLRQEMQSEHTSEDKSQGAEAVDPTLGYVVVDSYLNQQRSDQPEQRRDNQ